MGKIKSQHGKFVATYKDDVNGAAFLARLKVDEHDDKYQSRIISEYLGREFSLNERKNQHVDGRVDDRTPREKFYAPLFKTKQKQSSERETGFEKIKADYEKAGYSAELDRIYRTPAGPKRSLAILNHLEQKKIQQWAEEAQGNDDLTETPLYEELLKTFDEVMWDATVPQSEIDAFNQAIAQHECKNACPEFARDLAATYMEKRETRLRSIENAKEEEVRKLQAAINDIQGKRRRKTKAETEEEQAAIAAYNLEETRLLGLDDISRDVIKKNEAHNKALADAKKTAEVTNNE